MSSATVNLAFCRAEAVKCIGSSVWAGDRVGEVCHLPGDSVLWGRMLCKSKHGLLRKSLGWQGLILCCCVA